MSNRTLSDNWTLQDVATLLSSGLDNTTTASIIKIDRDRDRFAYGEVSGAAVLMESLFSFLHDLILRDQIVVDEHFIDTWLGRAAALDALRDSAVIRPFPFRHDFSKVLDVRPEFERRLCVTSDLRNAHAENVRAREQEQSEPHAFLSQTLWGGAGMIARGFVYEEPYTPHPIRRRLFADTGFYATETAALGRGQAVDRFESFIADKRAALVQQKYGDRELNSLALSLSPVVTRVIRESSSSSDLISTALSIREEYAELREWIRLFQAELGNPTTPKSRFESLLASVSNYIDSQHGIRPDGGLGFTLGIWALKISFRSNPLDAIRGHFGVRSALRKFILTETWDADLRRILGFFGHRSSKISLEVMEYFARAGSNRTDG